MTDKISIIKQILKTDEETDKKILSFLQLLQKENTRAQEKTIHIEERCSERKNILLDVDLNTGKEKIFGETENLSTTGAFIRTEKKIAIGEDIALKLIGPGGDELSFIAKAVRMNSDGIGVEIKGISKKNQKLFCGFVDKL